LRSGAGAVLVPPRPNLGPEPMPGRLSTSGWIGIWLIGASLSVGLFWWLRRSYWPRRSERARPRGPAGDDVPAGPFASRRDQMTAWSAEVRGTLADRFGEHWRARTTEEIAGDVSLIERLGDETAARLVRFLIDADRAKFDDREGLQPPLVDAVPEWVAGFVASSVPAAGARSMINGK
jgi:hypothetical protein